MRKAMLCFWILLSLVVSCQSHEPVPNDTLVVGIELYPEQPDPRLAIDALSFKVARLIYSGLLLRDESQNLVPDVAQSYTMPDAVTYDFILRDDVYFHNGKKLTSADVKATYESMLNEKLASPFRGEWSVLDKIETPEPNRIIFKLKNPYVPFLTLLSLGILPQDLAERAALGKPIERNEYVGTGPFQIVPQAAKTEKIRLTRFEKFYGGAPKIKNLTLWFIADNTLRTLELMKGRLDVVMNAVPYVMVNALKAKDNLKFEANVGINFNYLGFNFKNPYLQNKKVRMAIAYAIDRDKIIRYKLAGLARKADSVLSPVHWAYNSELTPFDFDLNKAKTLLDEAGFKDPDGDGPQKRFKLVYKTSTNKERLEIVQLIAENLRKIGIDVEVRSFEFGTLMRDLMQGDFDLFSLIWSGVNEPDQYYTIAHSSKFPPLGANRGRYVNKTLDPLLEAQRVETDVEKRKILLQKIQKMFYEDFVYVPLWYDYNYAVINKNVDGFHVRPDASFLNLVNATKAGQ